MKKGTLFEFAAILSVVVACSPSTESSQQRATCPGFVLSDEGAVVVPWPPDRATPQTVDDSLAALDAWLTQPQKQYYQCENRELVLAEVHFGLALLLRKYWNLDPAGPLGAELTSLGLSHSDDRSNFIALQYIHRLRNEPFDAKQYLANAQEHWRRFESATQD